MKYIEKLLNGAEVKWMTVEEISKNISSGGTPRSNVAAYYGGNIPWLRTQEVNFREIWDTGIKITEEGLNSSSAKYIPANCIIVAMYGATVGRVGINKIPLTTNQACANIEVNDNIAYYRYIYHYLSSQYEYIKSLGAGSQTNINAGIVKKIKVPIPPLYVQEEIVRILDKFTTLETELEAELDCRKRQYEYYRNQLLSFDMLNRGGQRLNNVKIMSLGELGTFIRGGGLQKKDFTLSGVGCIHYGQIYTYYGTYAKRTKSYVSQEFAQKARKAKNGDLIIATTSENDEDVCKAVAWLGDEEIAVSSDACFYAHTMNPKYVAYYFQTEQFQKQKRCFITGTKVRRVNSNDLAKIKIPVPPLAEQERIASILDKFDTLTNSISEGLPKEIELRRKQYEYYRNQLLSFPEHKATA